MTPATVGRFTLLGTLYFAQGLPFGFFVQALPVLLRAAGVSLSAIGFSGLLVLPWALKFLWAPVIDRRWWPRLGRRRSWILAMQLAGTVVLAAIAVVPGADALPALMTAMFVLNLIAATQDIATDGLAVELLPPGERGFANGLQVAGYRVGGALMAPGANGDRQRVQAAGTIVGSGLGLGAMGGYAVAPASSWSVSPWTAEDGSQGASVSIQGVIDLAL